MTACFFYSEIIIDSQKFTKKYIVRRESYHISLSPSIDHFCNFIWYQHEETDIRAYIDFTHFPCTCFVFLGSHILCSPVGCNCTSSRATPLAHSSLVVLCNHPGPFLTPDSRTTLHMLTVCFPKGLQCVAFSNCLLSLTRVVLHSL